MANLTPSLCSLNIVLWLGSEGHGFGTVFSPVWAGKRLFPIFKLRFYLHGHFSGPQGTNVGLLVVVEWQGVSLKFIS